MKFLRSEKLQLSIGCILIISFFLIFNFFVIGKYSSYPWWHFEASDGDQTFPAQAVSMINNSDITFLMHPAATLHSLNGMTYRLLSTFDPSHRKLISLDKVTSLQEVYDILEIAVRTSRILSLVVSILFVIFLFSFIYYLTRYLLLTFLVTFYIATCNGVMLHSYIIRMETLSLLFILGAIYIYLVTSKTNFLSFRKMSFAYTVIGLLIGLAVFTKVQTGPIIIIFLLGIFISCILNSKKDALVNIPLMATNNIIIVLLNILLTPWWALKKPAFLTPEYLQSLDPNGRAQYGSAPDYFCLWALVPLIVLLILSIVGYVIASPGGAKQSFFLLRLLRPPPWRGPRNDSRLLPTIFIFNQLLTGIILSVYVVFLPISTTIDKYVSNTHHLVYVVLTNIFGHAFLGNSMTIGEVIKQDIALHEGQSQLLNMNLFYLSFIVFIFCVRRFLSGTVGRDKKRDYGIVLLFLICGIMMDVLSGFRAPVLPAIQSIYAIYSICLYGIGLALWVSLEFGQRYESEPARILLVIFQGLVILVLSAHCIYKGYEFLKMPRADGISRQSPVAAYQNLLGQETFWKASQEALRKNGQQINN